MICHIVTRTDFSNVIMVQTTYSIKNDIATTHCLFIENYFPLISEKRCTLKLYIVTRRNFLRHCSITVHGKIVTDIVNATNHARSYRVNLK